MTDWIQTAAFPEEAGISSKGLLNYLDAVSASGQEPHAVMVLKNGKLACSFAYAPYDLHTPHVLYSLSKSFTSAAAGFAVADGLLRWDSRVIDVLAEEAPAEPDAWLSEVTLHHLLSMSSGLDPRSDRIPHNGNWARLVLSCGCNAQPGTRFHYNSHGSYLVSCMVQKVTGMNIRDYLMPRLFEPLGIPKPLWDESPQGACCGGWGLRLSCDSVARFGQCLLQNGLWNGKRILPEEWLEKATVFHTDTEHRTPAPTIEWAQGYCYQFWRCTDDRYRADGMYGQLCIVAPKQNMVVAVVAGMHNMAQEIALLNEHVFAHEPLPSTEQERTELKQRLSKLAYPWPEHDGTALSEACYQAENVSLRTDAAGAELSFSAYEHRFCLRFGLGRPAEGSFFTTGYPVRSLCQCGMDGDTLHLLMRSPEAPYHIKADVTFAENSAKLHMDGIGFDTLDLTLEKA